MTGGGGDLHPAYNLTTCLNNKTCFVWVAPLEANQCKMIQHANVIIHFRILSSHASTLVPLMLGCKLAFQGARVKGHTRHRANRDPKRPHKGSLKAYRYICKGRASILTPPAWATASTHEQLLCGSHPWSIKIESSSLLYTGLSTEFN